MEGDLNSCLYETVSYWEKSSRSRGSTQLARELEVDILDDDDCSEDDMFIVDERSELTSINW